ncbi:putative membrane protein [Micavibrio aeruginosavorus ARL-13]|uniref:Putative membrane protein n=2 Tax=Micavibrio aeruginosavorus TaxID=349221 RepID=G2KPH4_MICAA|nr:putative membrane protein [Micavibrio aeruginosavorus ARL-13]
MGCGITISLLTIAIARFFTILGAGGSFTEQKIMLIAPPCFALGIIIFLIGNFIRKQDYKNDDA